MRSLGSAGGATQRVWRHTPPAVLVIATLAPSARAGAAEPLPTPFEFVSTECARRSGHRDLAFHVVWFDVGELLPDNEAEVEREVRSIFSPLGVDVEWETGRSERILVDDARVPQIPVMLPGTGSRMRQAMSPPRSLKMVSADLRSL